MSSNAPPPPPAPPSYPPPPPGYPYPYPPPTTGSPPGRTRRLLLVLGIATLAAVLLVAAVLATGLGCSTTSFACPHAGNPNLGTCLSLSAPPASSGVPSESTWDWCVNASDAIVERMFVQLSIVIAGDPVVIPGGIGELPPGHFASSPTLSQPCNMPVFTDNSTGGGRSSGGYLEIASPWAFTYTLEDFFSLWHDSDSTVDVNGVTEPITYSGDQIFNYSDSANGAQVVRLWIDGTQVATGPSQVLNYEISSYDTSQDVPSCFLSDYGSDHSIEITWGWAGAGE